MPALRPKTPCPPALVFAALGLLCSSCTVPDLQELERERPRACDAEHVCAAGYECVDGLCQVRTSGPERECQPGERSACGLNVGRCEAGERACGSDGKFGPCVGAVEPVDEQCNLIDDDCDGAVDEQLRGAPCALQQGVCAGAKAACVNGAFEATCTAVSYDAGFQAVEASCDGLDNDCDGATDEGLSSPCQLQLGVCAGALAACVAGAFVPCAAADYRAHHASYEAVELSCDTVDNDCDGTADQPVAINVSSSPGVPSRAAALARSSAADGGAQLLVLAEEGTKVAARVVSPEGVGPPVLPSDSLLGASAARGPALGFDEGRVLAAWIEDRAGLAHAFIAPLGSDGRSLLRTSPDGGGSPAALQLALPSGLPPVRLAVAVSGDRFALAAEDSNQGVHLIVLPAPLSVSTTPVRSFTLSPAATSPELAPALPAGSFVATFAPVDGGVVVTAVGPAGLEQGSVRLTAGGDARAPHAFVSSDGGERQLEIFYLSGGALRHQRCALDGGCGAGSLFAQVTAPDLRELHVALPLAGEAPRFATWQQGLAGDAGVRAYWDLDAGSRLFTAPSAPAFRPAALEARGGQGAVVAYDDDGAGPPGELRLFNVCGP